MAVFLIGGIFLGAMAVITPDNMNTEIAPLVLGYFFIGWNESVCLANFTILVHDQNEIGVAGGCWHGWLSSSSDMCRCGCRIYTTILSNRSTETIVAELPRALTEAGLPASSVSQFIEVLSIGTAEAVQAAPGFTENILVVGTRAYKLANADAYRTVYYSTLAFSGLAVFLTFYAPNTDEYMTGKVAATLHREVASESQEKDFKKV